MHPRAGGPPVVVENFIRETTRCGHQSEIISTPLFCSGDEKKLLRRLNELAPTAFFPKSKASLLISRKVRDQLEQSVRAADIVHVHTLWNPINFLIRRECARQTRPYVLMPHGYLDPYSLKVKRWRKAAYLRAIESKTLFAARRLIFTTPEEMRLAGTAISSFPNGVVIPLGGDAPTEKSEELRYVFFKRFPKARGRRQLLFCGRLDFKKGLDRILTVLPSIIKNFPDVLLTVVGEGSFEFKEMLDRTIAAKGMEKNVLFTGWLGSTAKWGAYASAEVFLLPSRHENFAIAVAEAMQMGVPVIVSNRVNTWPYIREAGAGLVLDEEGLNAELEKGLLSLLRDRTRLSLMGASGREYARKKLTWSRATSELLKCYEEVLLRTATSYE
jgi:glycosyltransferase involved in cell wall biosynthesis